MYAATVPLLIQTHFLSFPVLLRGPRSCTPGNLMRGSRPRGLRLSCTNERCRAELDWETTLPPCLGQASCRGSETPTTAPVSRFPTTFTLKTRTVVVQAAHCGLSWAIQHLRGVLSAHSLIHSPFLKRSLELTEFYSRWSPD